jgi:hypothetical protein
MGYAFRRQVAVQQLGPALLRIDCKPRSTGKMATSL